jgi:hypothetical protein
MTAMSVIFSDHAMRRAQQRGIRPGVVDFVLGNADRDLEAGNGCRAYRISRTGAAELIRKGDKQHKGTAAKALSANANQQSNVYSPFTPRRLPR